MLSIILTSAVIILVLMTGTWLLSVILKEMSIVDVGWGLGFVILTIFHASRLDSLEPKQFLICYMIALWGFRLALYILVRNWGKGEDPRYKAWRKDWGKDTWWISYFKVFLLQGVLMLIISLPVQSVMFQSGDSIGFLQIAGVCIWGLGFFFETIADLQLYLFKRKPSNKGGVMQSGLWKYSRHPNYFGETLVWWGVFLVSAGSGYLLLSLISPVLITFMLLKVSGVTMVEARYEGNDAYSKYKRNTSPFFPLPPKKTV